MNPVALAVVAVILAGGHAAHAAYQTCNGKVVASELVRCPDNSIPSYVPGSPPAVAAPAAAPAIGLFGIWHTTKPGAAYQTAIDVPGAQSLGIRPGLAPGDLTISANGTYVWNTYTGTSGRWLKGEGEAITLFDEALHKRWTVALKPGQMTVTDGKVTEYGRR